MKKTSIILLVLALLFTVGCGRQGQEQEGQAYTICEVNKEETKVTERKIYTKETDATELVSIFMDELGRVSGNADTRPAIPSNVTVNSYTFSDGTVTLNFGTDYNSMSHIGEILSRAAIVRTLTQIAEVKFVTILVDGNPLLNSSGVPVGVLTAEQFIDNSGNVINTEEIASLTLYFTNEEGNKLVKVNREVVYSSNISLEKLVIEQLIKGVEEDEKEDGVYPVLNPATEVVAVTVRDGVCYVNLNEDFLVPTTNASAEVVLYSIANSLVELSNVNKVQFFVGGENELTYKETMPLSETYGRNLELVEGGQ